MFALLQRQPLYGLLPVGEGGISDGFTLSPSLSLCLPASVLRCLPVSLIQETIHALAASLGAASVEELVHQRGFAVI